MKKLLMTLLIIGMLTGAGIVIAKPPPCNFVITSFKDISEEQGGGSMWFLGEVKNIGKEAGEPILRVIGYDKNGELVDTDDNHLNKGFDMPPGESTVFKIISIKRKGVKRYSYQIIRVMVWGD
jgi:hypothetical protein